MDSKEKFVLLKNAAANVARGSAAAFVAIALPPFLTRLMSVDAYGAWSLVLQLSAFVGYLDFGIQTAIGRFVARAGESGDEEYRDRILSTSTAALVLAAVLGIAGTLGLALVMPHIFHQVPRLLLWDSRWALILVGTSLAIGLPFSIFNAIFVGLQRYEVPAAVIGGSRIIGAVLVVLVVRQGGSLTHMAGAMAAVNVATYGLQYLCYRKFAPPMQFSSKLVSRKACGELFDYCLSLSIWSFAMLLVTGLDVSLVGYFEFDKVAYYSVGATLVIFLAGIQNALFNVMIPSAAVLEARGNSIQLGRGMITATRYGNLFLLAMGLPIIFAAKFILTVWVGPKYAMQGARILQILTAANIIRLSAVPYVMTLIGTGQQRLVVLTPLLEGCSNLIVSVIGGYFLGAMGVAIGTLAGAIVGVLGNFFYNMRRTTGIDFRIAEYVRDGLFRPAVCALPLTVAALALRFSEPLIPGAGFATIGSAMVATIFLVWRCGLVGSERDKLRVHHFVAEG